MQIAPFASTLSSTVLFIDSAVDHLHELTSHVIPGIDVVVLHPAEDGVAQISTMLRSRSHISSLHIVAHGSPGSLRLGNTHLSLESLANYQESLAQWRDALSPDASILLYGCNVAAGARGREFIQQLKQRLGAEVAASSTPVGSADQGGNWQLDVETGAIATQLAFQPAVMATYAAVFVDTYIDEDFSSGSGSTPPDGWTVEVIEGDSEVDLWRFDNPGDRNIPRYQTEPVAIFDSDALSNNDLAENVALISPTFDATSESQVFLEFNQKYLALVDPDYGSESFIEVYDGTTWQTVATQVTTDVRGTTRFDISEYAAGVADAQVRFRYEGNWSYYWSIDDVKVADALTPGVTVLRGAPRVSESNVPDTRNFSFVLDSKPTSDVTISFGVDDSQLAPITALTFTPDNWNIPQSATVNAIADGIREGAKQTSSIEITVTSADDAYNDLSIPTATATITDHTIPGFRSYRTVEKTYSDLETLANANPNIATWLDIGDSYDKATPGGAPGYDIHVLQLTNTSTNPEGGKPALYLEGGLHAREYSTNEVATRFGEYLVNNYGTDPDITWLLDYFTININPVANPDGRKFAEQGYSWRKNTNPTAPEGTEPAAFPNYGVDLNRNHPFEWGNVPGGSSGDPSSDVYRGAEPASEPEVQAIENFASSIFPDQRGPNKDDPAPEDATGVFIDLHSFGNTILYPWGSTSDPAPNREGLRNLGLKFGYYTDANGTPYDIYQSIGLYPTDGTTDDWAYGTLGVAAYTWELGTRFFESSGYFEKSIINQTIPALVYAAKSARRPYQTAGGPESVNAAVDLGQVVAGITPVVLTATADDTRYADSNAEGLREGRRLPDAQNIVSARYSIDSPSWIPDTEFYKLKAVDGRFNNPVEELTASIDTSDLEPGRHTIFIESLDKDGNYGVPVAVFLDVLPAPNNAVTLRGDRQANVLTGSQENNVIYGGDGDDRVSSGSGDDLLMGENGSDRINGQGQDDLVYGGDGNDDLQGGAGDDRVYGGAGRDRLQGDEDNDLLWGGADNDHLIGGKGADTYVLAIGEGTDTIKRFNENSDRLGLAGTLKFSQLSIAERKDDTLIQLGNEVLAKLDVEADSLTRTSFVPV